LALALKLPALLTSLIVIIVIVICGPYYSQRAVFASPLSAFSFPSVPIGADFGFEVPRQSSNGL